MNTRYEVGLIYARAVRSVEKKAKTRRDQTATTGEYVRFVQALDFGEAGSGRRMRLFI